jgi:hypothetical protein
MFDFLNLPPELQIMIYEYALLSGGHMIKRDNLPCLPTIRYRYSEGPKFMQEKHDVHQTIYCNNWDCRDQSVEPEHELEPLRTEDVAFGLFLTSRKVSATTIAIFFGKRHFIFENYFDLCMFLTVAGTQARHVKSLTFNWRKDREFHQEQVNARNGPWRLRSGGTRNPTALASLDLLSEACPELSYVEMLSRAQDWRVNGGPFGACPDRPEVQVLCKMPLLLAFEYLSIDEPRRKRIAAQRLPSRPSHRSTQFCTVLAKEKRSERAVEARIRKSIEERTTKEVDGEEEKNGDGGGGLRKRLWRG